MSFFSKSKVVVWPKADSLDIYLDRADNNTYSFEINLWEEQSEDSLKNLATFLHQNKIISAYILLDDHQVNTKTFIYDSIVEKLDPNEVVTLAKDSIDFKISAESVNFDLEKVDNRTLVRTRIFHQDKINLLLENIRKIGLQILSFETISSSIAKLYANFDNGQHFFFYPVNSYEYLAILASGGNVYLTTFIKKTLPELKKLLNYAQAYFNNKSPKQYLPDTDYQEANICQSFHKATNIPLPVLSFFVGTQKPAAIISTGTPVTNSSPSIPMENQKRNLLPIIAVFVVTAVAASLIVWFILNQNSKGTDLNPGGETLPTIAPTAVITQAPTSTPTPASKPSASLKIQVLNATEINGQAATIKTALAKLGFSSVTTGNSTESATTNQIQAKQASAAAYFQQQVKSFATATVTDLAADSKYDLVFIIGVDLSQ